MFRNKPRLTIVYPEFFNQVASVDPLDWQRYLPNIANIVHRGQILDAGERSIESEVLGSFGYDEESNQFAAISAANDGVEGEECLARADPIHLRADGPRLRICSGEFFEPSAEEAILLVRDLNERIPECHFLVGGHPSRWYLRLPKRLAFQAKHPSQIFQRTLDEVLPSGKDAGYLHRLLNEIQMVLHQSEVNQEREARGLVAINSLWIWGNGGAGSRSSIHTPIVYGDDVLVRSLARLAGSETKPLDRFGERGKHATDSENILLMINQPCGPLEAREAAIDLAAFDNKWGKQILNGVQFGTYSSLRIIDHKRHLELSSIAAWMVWRRTSYFSQRLDVRVDALKISKDVSE